MYSLLKELYSSKFSEAGEPGVSTLLLCGAASTTCGQLFTYPLQLTRTRLQAQGMKGRCVRYCVHAFVYPYAPVRWFLRVCLLLVEVFDLLVKLKLSAYVF